MNEAELVKCYMELGLTEEQARHIIEATKKELDDEQSDET